jgi:hypothetical protein
MERNPGSIRSKLNKLQDKKSNESIEWILIDDEVVDTGNVVNAFLLPDELFEEETPAKSDSNSKQVAEKEVIETVEETESRRRVVSKSPSPWHESPYSFVDNENALLLSPIRSQAENKPKKPALRKYGSKASSMTSSVNKCQSENVDEQPPSSQSGRLTRTRQMASLANKIDYKPKEDSNEDDESKKIDVFVATRSRKRKHVICDQIPAASSTENVVDIENVSSEADLGQSRPKRSNSRNVDSKKQQKRTPLAVVDQNVQEEVGEERNEEPAAREVEKQVESEANATAQPEIVTYQDLDEVATYLVEVRRLF